ncbi:hypothetical protein CDD80_6359 [Ophiocordyceps camponoti-rufipedis]|uniref:Uncharacterized protein n=1 Tax=Ophiocordyceps camponoti-rufipedis TaxID=2004952 RepID=A0A2C5ZH19_9HYPO|nr:hypothetical protein CDD80_6359 [Ophiocordyceps camponoti-rufipedis]
MTKLSLLVAAFAPYLAHATVGWNWGFFQVPPDGLDHIVFPMQMTQVGHEAGYYFAQQFDFTNTEHGGYIGLQPRPQRDGRSVIHAVFSTFQGGSRSNHPNCHYGADNGPGVSCALEIYGSYDHVYHMTVEKIEGTTWRGLMVDAVTGGTFEIGVWSLPNSSGNMKPFLGGFIEYYTWNRAQGPDCPRQTKTNVTLFNPSSKTPGASGGILLEPFDYGDCEGQVNFEVLNVKGGRNIAYGIAEPAVTTQNAEELDATGFPDDGLMFRDNCIVEPDWRRGFGVASYM